MFGKSLHHVVVHVRDVAIGVRGVGVVLRRGSRPLSREVTTPSKDLGHASWSDGGVGPRPHIMASSFLECGVG